MYLEKNPALATFLAPCIGYMEASKIAKQAVQQGRSVKEIALEKGLLKPEELERIFKPKHLLGKKDD
jgi:fumarate hydratase class II